MEGWKNIAGYEGMYQVSSDGKVRSLNWRNRGIIKELSMKETSPGQFQVELTKEGKRKTFSVQALVDEAFPADLPQKDTKPQGKPINQLTIYGETVKRWEDISQVHKELGYHPGTIFECCQSQQKTAYGFRWQYAV